MVLGFSPDWHTVHSKQSHDYSAGRADSHLPCTGHWNLCKTPHIQYCNHTLERVCDVKSKEETLKSLYTDTPAFVEIHVMPSVLVEKDAGEKFHVLHYTHGDGRHVPEGETTGTIGRRECCIDWLLGACAYSSDYIKVCLTKDMNLRNGISYPSILL